MLSVGAAGGEYTASAIREHFYDGKDNKDLTESEKESISNWSQIASGAAAFAGSGGSLNNVSTAVSASKNAVENNFMAQEVMNEYEKNHKDGLLLFNGDEKKAAEYANGIIIDKGQAALIGLGALAAPVLPESAIIGGLLSGTINAGAQYILNDDGNVNWTDVGIASGVGAVTGGAGTVFWGTVAWNAAGGATSSYLEGKDPLVGAATGTISSGVGYFGGKWLEGSLQKSFNPVSKQYEWVSIGVWTITKPAAQSSVPAISGSTLDSGLSEITQEIIDNKLKKIENEKK